jgi:pimeloyl-ACP methyl ester carboxylesterase
MREYLVDAGTLQMSVREHPGGSPPFLALHGLASNARWWDLVAARLSPRWRVLAPDLRGHGRSERPEAGYSFPEVVGDLRGLVETASLDRVIVAGHSWGASVALWFAATLPERVLGCVCVDGGAADMKEHFPTWAEAEERLRPPRLTGITEATVREWARGGSLAEGGDPEAAADILLGNFEDAPDGTVRPRLDMDHHMEIARRLYELDSFELMARVECPVLFIPARGGPWPAEAKARSAQRAQEVLGGDRTKVVWVDGGHDLPVQRPAEVAKAMAEFAASLA